MIEYEYLYFSKNLVSKKYFLESTFVYFYFEGLFIIFMFLGGHWMHTPLLIPSKKSISQSNVVSYKKSGLNKIICHGSVTARWTCKFVVSQELSGIVSAVSPDVNGSVSWSVVSLGSVEVFAVSWKVSEGVGYEQEV